MVGLKGCKRMADPIRDLIDRVVELVFLIEVEFENEAAQVD